jgi:putative hydrolase of the HAD superfamily
MARYKAVLFDLGGTLVAYYKSAEFQGILERAINGIQQFLFETMAITYDQVTLWERVEAENHEADDFRVRPLEDRLVNIFQLQDLADEHAFIAKVCTIFTNRIFEIGTIFPDTIEVLDEIKGRGLRIGLVSNTPWGSPANLWREELRRLDLLHRFDITVFCRDAGWRKPASQIFARALSMLELDSTDCLFVGDDPRWDVNGPLAVGMNAVLIDRTDDSHGDTTISSLQELFEIL